MRRGKLGIRTALAICTVLLCGALIAPAAQAEFGLHDFGVTFENEDGTPATQAGSHPYAMTTQFGVNDLGEIGPFEFALDGQLKDLNIEQIAGLVGDATAMSQCSNAGFLHGVGLFENISDCPDETVLGIQASDLLGPEIIWLQGPVYNLEPPPGVVVRLGLRVLTVTVTVDIRVKQSGEYNVVASSRIPQIIELFSSTLQLWGVPGDSGHDHLRGPCGGTLFEGKFQGFAPGSQSCPSNAPKKPFLTLPTNCAGPLTTSYAANPWLEPTKFVFGSSITHDNAEPPNSQGFTGCGKLGFQPEVSSKTTSDSAETGTGLDFDVDFHDEGLKNPEGLAQSVPKKAEITLPEGVTINPSIAEGLGVCTPADIDRETIDSIPGEGCPNSSKIGTLHIESPLVDEGIDGSVFLAQQDDPTTATPGAENPFDSLVALYLVLRNPNLGVLVKLPLKVEPDPKTGRLVATLENIPQLPFSHFNFHFREGQRAPLVTPNACGAYTTEAKFYPWSDPSDPRTVSSSFDVTEGVAGGPCPSGGVPPFHPGFEAGSINNNAGSYSPFDMRLLRSDGDQDMTKFSSVLPPGVLGKLAGLSKCPDAAIEAAKAKTARQELASPSCPANSEIGHSLAGAGVGSALTYVPGKIYLGGPYQGDPLSVISVTPALAGPFDAGTVVTRLALTLNPETAEVEVDGANSDPIPHILKGIVLKVRDIRVYVDRDNFILNPTSCDPSSAKATLFGGFLDVFSPADDVPVDLSTRYQAANCLNLGFKPKLKLQLNGGTKRGDHPALRAELNARPGDANIGAVTVTLPRSAFLDQAHIRTICTRVQFAAKNCPKGSEYGYAKAWTPLLDEPIEGPVYLRSSDHKLPDLVIALHGLVDVNVSSRIDSKHGGIRNSFEAVPDAPVSKFVLNLQGGKKGLVVNSRNLCSAPSRADARFTGQNGIPYDFHPLLKPSCGGKGKKGK